MHVGGVQETSIRESVDLLCRDGTDTLSCNCSESFCSHNKKLSGQLQALAWGVSWYHESCITTSIHPPGECLGSPSLDKEDETAVVCG